MEETGESSIQYLLSLWPYYLDLLSSSINALHLIAFFLYKTVGECVVFVEKEGFSVLVEGRTVDEDIVTKSVDMWCVNNIYELLIIILYFNDFSKSLTTS